MRALYYPYPLLSEHLLVEGDQAHHFIKVLRIEKGEEVLLLNGEGEKAFAQVEEITKKEMVLKINKRQQMERQVSLDIALGVVKKDALEEIVKAAVEMGIRNLYLIRTQYSQTMPEWSERWQKLLITALEQSNNPYLTKVIQLSELKELPWAQYQNIVTMSPHENSEKLPANINQECLMLIGPEGGFSPAEEAYLGEKKSHFIKLPLPILRAKTATILSVGFLIGLSRK